MNNQKKTSCRLMVVKMIESHRTVDDDEHDETHSRPSIENSSKTVKRPISSITKASTIPKKKIKIDTSNESKQKVSTINNEKTKTDHDEQNRKVTKKLTKIPSNIDLKVSTETKKKFDLKMTKNISPSKNTSTKISATSNSVGKKSLINENVNPKKKKISTSISQKLQSSSIKEVPKRYERDDLQLSEDSNSAEATEKVSTSTHIIDHLSDKNEFSLHHDDFQLPTGLTDENLRFKLTYIYQRVQSNSNDDLLVFVRFLKRNRLIDLSSISIDPKNADEKFIYDLFTLSPIHIRELANDLGYQSIRSV